MPFHFTLSSLLRLRESLEKIELQRLQTIAAQVAQVCAEIDSIDAEIEASRQQVLEQASIGMSGAELHIAVLGDSARKERRIALLAKRDKLERARQEQQIRFTEARRQREILSNLRQRQLSAYQREQSRREQQQIDELFLIRRSSKRHSGGDRRKSGQD